VVAVSLAFENNFRVCQLFYNGIMENWPSAYRYDFDMKNKVLWTISANINFVPCLYE
jgi:hypothetical protein